MSCNDVVVFILALLQSLYATPSTQNRHRSNEYYSVHLCSMTCGSTILEFVNGNITEFMRELYIFYMFCWCSIGENNNSNVNVLGVLREMYHSCDGIYTLILLCPDCLVYCVLPFSLTLTWDIGVCFYVIKFVLALTPEFMISFYFLLFDSATSPVHSCCYLASMIHNSTHVIL